jgi:DNA-binding ferritin-like protein
MNTCDLISQILAVNQDEIDAFLASENATLNLFTLNLENSHWNVFARAQFRVVQHLHNFPVFEIIYQDI